MNPEIERPVERLLRTLGIVAHEERHLSFSRSRIFAERIGVAWVEGLEQDPERAERLEAFVSRFGRMQDTLGKRLLPRWLIAQAEEPGSLVEVLSRAERLGVVADAERWLERRRRRPLPPSGAALGRPVSAVMRPVAELRTPPTRDRP